MSYLVANPEDRFSRDEAHMKVVYMCRPEFENGGLRERPLAEN